MIGFDILDKLRDKVRSVKKGEHEDLARETCEKLHRSLMERPIVRHYIKHLRRHKQPRNTQPWMALGEMLMQAGTACLLRAW